jgi:hypothetical protein
MMSTTQGPQVRQVESQVRTFGNRHDMIDFQILFVEVPFGQAVLTTGMLSQIDLADPLPPVIIAPLWSRSATSIRRTPGPFGLMLFAIAGTGQLRTAPHTTAGFQLARHGRLLGHNRGTPEEVW